MILFRCTQKLLKLSRIKPQEPPPILPRTSLGEWYVNVISLTFPGKSAVIYTHAPSRLTVITVGRSLKKTIPIFQSRLFSLLSRIGVNEQFAQMQRLAFDDYLICKTASKSMLGSMNEIKYLIQNEASYSASLESLDLNKLEDYLSGYLFGSKDIRKDYFTPREYLKGHLFLNLN